MELKIKTTDLQDMVGKSIKCVSNNKLIPITSLINISVKDHKFQLITTDATNYFYVSSSDKFDCDDFEVSVIADTFVKLIQKTTSEYVILEFDGTSFKVRGNGTYNIELPLDENGDVIKFPKKLTDDFKILVSEINLSTVKTILMYNKPSLALSVELPALTNYYCGKSVVTSDRFKICKSDINMFDTPMLISSQFMDLVGATDSEVITVTRSDNAIIFECGNDTVYAPIIEGVDTFPIDPIIQLTDTPFPSECKVSRVSVLDLLDRLSLFVTKYDKKAVRLTFTHDGIMFSSKQSSGVELIPFTESNNFSEYTCMVDIDMFKSQVASQAADILHLYYGSDISLKMVTDNITQIVALAEEE